MRKSFHDFLHRLVGQLGVEPIPARVLSGIKPGLHVGLERIQIHSSERCGRNHVQLAQREVRDLLEVGQHRLERHDLRQMRIGLGRDRHPREAIDHLRVDWVLDPERPVLVEGRPREERRGACPSEASVP